MKNANALQAKIEQIFKGYDLEAHETAALNEMMAELPKMSQADINAAFASIAEMLQCCYALKFTQI